MPTRQAEGLVPSLRRTVLARQTAARSDGELLGAFVAARDADAFAELVRRHGPMVLGVCRRVVGERTAAEDAFQAAFLVLARRAASVRPREQVGNWLYGVAYRTALKARMVLARRRAREKQVAAMPEPTATAAPAADWSDIQPVIDEELARLPDRLRLPVVLCDLEGRPQREVAKRLNVPPATLATRLASARRTLAQRLTRRGVALSGGALAGLLGLHGAASAVPPALAAGSVRAAEAVAAGVGLDALVSAHAVQLSEGVMRMMMLSKLQAVAVTALAALALTTGLGLGLVPAVAGDSEPGPGAKSVPAARPNSFHARIAAAKQPRREADPAPDDATFLRRLCLDVAGVPPTPLEVWFFVSDQDADKRAKVVDWLVADDALKAAVARKLGVPPERVKFLRTRLSADGRSVEMRFAEGPLNLAFTPDGQKVVAGFSRLLLAASPDALQPLALDVGYPQQRGAIQQQLLSDIEADGRVELVWNLADDEQLKRYRVVVNELYAEATLPRSDAEFLKRVVKDIRGGEPTALELKYFAADKDPKKREKLLDELLKDPAVQKKLGREWKRKMLAPPQGPRAVTEYLFVDEDKPRQTVPYRLNLNVAIPSKFEKLVDELLAAKKSDEAILEGLTLAALGRLPTDAEKKLALPGIATAKDRKAAWAAVAKSLAGEGAKANDSLWLDLQVQPPPPVPPAKP